MLKDKVENFQFILWLFLSYTHLVFFLPLTVLVADKDTQTQIFIHQFLFNDVIWILTVKNKNNLIIISCPLHGISVFHIVTTKMSPDVLINPLGDNITCS